MTEEEADQSSSLRRCRKQFLRERLARLGLGGDRSTTNASSAKEAAGKATKDKENMGR